MLKHALRPLKGCDLYLCMKCIILSHGNSHVIHMMLEFHGKLLKWFQEDRYEFCVR
jgi:hypothetical protein